MGKHLCSRTENSKTAFNHTVVSPREYSADQKRPRKSGSSSASLRGFHEIVMNILENNEKANAGNEKAWEWT